VWRFPAGKYANPVVADKERMYLTGRAGVYAFAKPGSKVVKDYLRRARKRKQRAESRSGESQEKKSDRG
jgi:protein required for attachment to host cells